MGTEARKIGHCKLLHTVIFLIAMISFTLHGLNVRAASVMPSDYRSTAGVGNFKDSWQFAVAFRMRPTRRLWARHFELALGTISTSQESRAFVSVGPVWRLPINRQALFVELGVSPTWISGSSFNGRDLGGNFHFTSSAAAGATFGVRNSVALALRIQHMSNGGLSSINPGMDMIGLNITFNISNR